jgi:methionine-R-sulfoxide reductase
MAYDPDRGRFWMIFLAVAAVAIAVVYFAAEPLSGWGDRRVYAGGGNGKEDAMDPSMVTVRLLDDEGRLTGLVVVPRVVKTDEEWQRQLTPEQYRITRDKGTERPFCGRFNEYDVPGTYACVCCGLPLFQSDAKFHSGSGWPSFFRPVAKENIVTQSDLSWGMIRTEILCARCGAHLGHVFDDGPPPTGQRYCLNSESMNFIPKKK